MKRGLGIPLLMMMLSVIWLPNLINQKDYLIKKTTILSLNKNKSGKIIYQLKKGRYKIRISPNVNIDSYIVGEGEEFNPTIYEDTAEYEIDTNKERESFKQEYNSKKNSKVKIEIEKIE